MSMGGPKLSLGTRTLSQLEVRSLSEKISDEEFSYIISLKGRADYKARNILKRAMSESKIIPYTKKQKIFTKLRKIKTLIF